MCICIYIYIYMVAVLTARLLSALSHRQCNDRAEQSRAEQSRATGNGRAAKESAQNLSRAPQEASFWTPLHSARVEPLS